jgi:asparagine synthase (glutamine-hydrolysing)
MSGLAGVWHLDGRPAEVSDISSVASTMAHRGPDGCSIRSAGSLAVACQLLRVTPESAQESQPATDWRTNVLVFDGRLDNRTELLGELEGPDVRADCADSALVLAGWRTWGDAFLSHLNGEFALALFDAQTRTLRLARDPVGLRPLYYWSNGTTFVFASEIKGILAYPDVPRKMNEDLLADFFLLDRLPYDDEGETFFQDVHAVRPGQCVTVNNARIIVEQFWDFSPEDQVRYAGYADYADRLRELLVQAVRRRVRSVFPIAIATSGGLDSSIVLCVADELRRDGAASATLVPVSCTPNDDPGLEENQFIGLLESTRALRVHRAPPGRPGTLPQLMSAAWHSEWPRLDDGWQVQEPMMSVAKDLGARTILTGLWSDQTQFATAYLSDLATRFAWRQINGHLEEYGRWFVDADPSYFRSRLRRELFFNLTPHALRACLRPLHHALVGRSVRSRGTRALASRLSRRRPRVNRPRAATAHAREIYQVVRTASHRLQFEADEKLVAGYGMESSTPFLDRDVLSYLMSIPGDVQNRGGVPRALLREAMRGIVPDAILSRRWRVEGLSCPRFARNRLDAYLSSAPLAVARALGFLPDEKRADDALEFLALECWSRAFFSDTLAPPRLSFEGDCEPMTTPAAPKNDGDARLPYSAPRLTIHGDLRTITAAKEGNRDEAGQPKTYTNTMP